MQHETRTRGGAAWCLALLALVGCGRNIGGPVDAARADDSQTSLLADADVVVGESLSGTVGPEGGELRGVGVTLRIPAGALDRTIMLRAEDTGLAPPPPYAAYGNVWRFTPEGLTFAHPVTISLRFRRGPDAAIAWSRASGDGYEWRGGEVAGDTISAQVEHFSTGFVAQLGSLDAAVVDVVTVDVAPSPDVLSPDGGAPMDVASDDLGVSVDGPATDVVDASAAMDVLDAGPAAMDAVTAMDVPDVGSAADVVDATAARDVAASDAGSPADVIGCRAADAGPGGDPDDLPGLEIAIDAPAISVETSRLTPVSNVGTTCSLSGGRSEFRDAVLRFHLDAARDVTALVDGLGATTTFVQIQSACAPDATPIGACEQSSSAQSLVRRNLPAGDYVVVVELLNPAASFTAEIRTSAPTPLPVGDVCATPLEVAVDGPAVTLATAGLNAVADVGLPCATPANHAGNVDAVWHFHLDAVRDVAITTAGGPTSMWWRLQRWGCAANSTVVGSCSATGSASIRSFVSQTPGDYYLIGEWPRGFDGAISVTVATSASTPRNPGDLCTNPIVVVPDGPAAMVPESQLARVVDDGAWGYGTDADFAYTLTETRDVVVSVSHTDGGSAVGFLVNARCGEQVSDLGLYRNDGAYNHGELILPRQAPGTWFIGASGLTTPSNYVAQVRTYPAGSVSTYTMSTPPLAWIPACGVAGSTVVLGVGTRNAFTPLPFAFRVWGNPIPAGFPVNVSANGFFNFDGVATVGDAATFPNPQAPNGTVAVYPSTRNVRAPGVCTLVVGRAPHRRWVVEFNQMSRSALSVQSNPQAEAILNEGSNAIDFLYNADTDYAVASGVENFSGLAAVFWERPHPPGASFRMTPSQ